MIWIFTGLPRSGKTYRAVKYINDYFINHKSKEYSKFEFLYTNIGGFKYKEINEILSSHPVSKSDDEAYIKQAFPLKFEKIYAHLVKLYEMSEADKEDDELIEYLKKENMHNSLFVVDECYRYFSKRSDPVLVWWLAYHGHLGMDIILILQNKALMHSDYKSFTEFFIDAQPKSKSLRPNQLRYHHYASDSYTDKQKFNSDSITAKKDIFDLYKSGDVHKPKQIIYKFILYFFLALLSAYFMISFLMNRHTPDEVSSSAHEQTLVTPGGNNTPGQNINKNSELITIRCDDKFCWSTDRTYERFEISKTYFKFLAVKYEFDMQFSEINVEIFRYKHLKRGVQKITLANMTDYYYMIPKKIKKTHLANFFKITKKEYSAPQNNNNSNSKSILNSFTNNKNDKDTNI